MVSALFNFGAAPFDAFFPSLSERLAGLNAGGIGSAKALLASLSLIVSATCAAPLQRRLGVVGACITGLSLSALGLAGVAAAASAHGNRGRRRQGRRHEYRTLLARAARAKLVERIHGNRRNRNEYGGPATIP